jgi:hypothetical protein
MGRQALAVQQNVFLRPPAVATPISVVPTMQKINFQSPVDVQDLLSFCEFTHRCASMLCVPEQTITLVCVRQDVMERHAGELYVHARPRFLPSFIPVQVGMLAFDQPV